MCITYNDIETQKDQWNLAIYVFDSWAFLPSE